ncbi:alpha-N-acetylglucosaminidase [Pedobacter sp. BS3]|uniref:alpha-N-acetylglucosaminidase n=1 Tax=Pedobacter sp. BS3 TaxID=2567937 RepID=UPI0011F01334|nr:alpha-N-acetylglucosaminidase [Pedobacter sp. BS3]TZF83169.1 alpha-N-acetylglucosaminidase [Pedobacter sp. BS3]
MQKLRYIAFITCLLIHLPGVKAQNNTVKPDLTEADKLIRRILKERSAAFTTAWIPQENGKDVFELEAKNNKIELRGSNALSVASALNYYLKYIAHCDITWNGTNLNLPNPLPLPAGLVRKSTPYQYRYYLNYCTFNYTMSWWNWERWEREIDWMALNGINMPLALTGQNAIWDKVYKSLGFTDEDLKGFFSGPAYFNWFWMGNLDGWGGPLPQSWMKSHQELQKKILERERAFGMTPVLPAFTGHVPPSFKDKFPQVKLKKTSWVGFPDVYILDPNEPMFTEIGRKFIEEETKVYGTNHLYSADTFNENTPPVNDSIYLNDVSKKVYQAMALADPKATWIMQGWLFYHGAKFWKEKQIKALLNAVPNDKMIILDLWSERYPVWSRTEAYYGKPWIWCMLHNFGQNVNMYGLMDRVAQHPAEALHNPAAGKLSGIGLTMEGIEQNPVMYELMLENVWNDQPVNLDEWLKGYVHRRYGQPNENADKAWSILRRTAYADTVTSGGPESIVTARPTFKANPGGTTTTKLAYDPAELLTAWQNLVAAAPELKNSDGFQYDLVDLTRQVLANYASVLQQQFAADYQKKNTRDFKTHSQQFLTLISDMDKLLATRKDFLLGNWLNAAKSWGTSPEETALYEKNARNLITLWGDKDSRLHEYACKQWSGMLNGFYRPRWQQFFVMVNKALEQGKEADLKAFEKDIKTWEWNWVNGKETYATVPNGNAVTIATAMYKKYYPVIERAYQESKK